MGLPKFGSPVIGLDLGSSNIKASYFDIVSGQYRFICASQAAGGNYSQGFDYCQAVQNAATTLETKTGRILMNSEGMIIVPVSTEGRGVGRVVITYSSGPAIRVLLAGLLEDVSLASAGHLVEMNYGEVVHQIGLFNQLPVVGQIDQVIRAKPDLIILAGGYDHGAEHSQENNIEIIRLICSVLPNYDRPIILYAGNQIFAQNVSENLSKLSQTRIAANLRPSYDIEDLNPAQRVMEEIVAEFRQRQSSSLQRLGKISDTPPASSAYSFGRAIRFFSKCLDPENGIMAIDIGTETTTIAAAIDGKHHLRVLPYGMGEPMASMTIPEELSGIRRWLPPRISKQKVRDYLWQKSLYPGSIPADSDSLAIEQAAAREIMRNSYADLADEFFSKEFIYGTILASGSVIANAPTSTQSLLMLLDGLEPIGIISIYLDRYAILSTMGAAARSDTDLAVQVLQSFAMEVLATVICPISRVPSGIPILDVTVEHQDCIQSAYIVKKGDLIQITIPTGQTATIHVKTRFSTWLDAAGKLSSSSFQVRGGGLGVIIDGRGRPLKLPMVQRKRWALLNKWFHSIKE
jgi:hypothetical protein